jgi:hypothetical protein
LWTCARNSGVRPAALLVAAGADLRDDVQILRVRRERLADDLVRDVRTVEVGGVDVRDAELDGSAEHVDRGVGVLRRPEDAGSGKLHGAVADAGEAEIGEAVGAAGKVVGCHGIHGAPVAAGQAEPRSSWDRRDQDRRPPRRYS